MLCPECDKQMLILEFREVEVDFCPSCDGVWLDQGELELLGGEENASSKVPQERKTNRRCPRCNKKMREGNYPGTKVALDTCKDGHGLWFDHGELVTVLESQGAFGAAAKLNEYFGAVFSNKKQND